MVDAIINKDTLEIFCPNCQEDEFIVFRRDFKEPGLYLCQK